MAVIVTHKIREYNKANSVNNHIVKNFGEDDTKVKYKSGIDLIDNLGGGTIMIPPLITKHDEKDYTWVNLSTYVASYSRTDLLGFISVVDIKRPSITHIAKRLHDILKDEYPNTLKIVSGRYLFDFISLNIIVVCYIIDVIKATNGEAIDFTWLAPMMDIKEARKEAEDKKKAKFRIRPKEVTDHFDDDGPDLPDTEAIFYYPDKYGNPKKGYVSKRWAPTPTEAGYTKPNIPVKKSFTERLRANTRKERPQPTQEQIAKSKERVGNYLKANSKTSDLLYMGPTYATTANNYTTGAPTTYFQDSTGLIYAADYSNPEVKSAIVDLGSSGQINYSTLDTKKLGEILEELGGELTVNPTDD